MPGQPDPASTPPLPPELGRGHPFRVARLSRREATPFEVTPDADTRAAIAEYLDLLKLRKLRFAGHLAPIEGGGWELVADLGATVVQPCRVSLAPVSTRIEEPVRRRFLPDYVMPDDDEAEIPEDVDTEALGQVIDPSAVMVEALALALPPFPRADDAGPGDTAVAEPGATPLADSAKPLSGLAALRDRLKK